MILRNIEKEEYNIIAEIHMKAFKDFFLTSLGKNFLKTYYKACLSCPESLNICATDSEGHIQGFSIGCVKSKGYHKRLILNNFFPFLLQGIIVLIIKPRSLIRLARNLQKKSSNNDDGNYSELLSIAVSPFIKGSGIGKELIKKFEIEAQKKGCKRIALTTDCYDNQSVLEFYKKSGYMISYEFTSYPNRRMYKLMKDINTN